MSERAPRHYAPYLRAPLVFDDDDDDGDGDGKQERENSTFCAKSWGNYQEGSRQDTRYSLSGLDLNQEKNIPMVKFSDST